MALFCIIFSCHPSGVSKEHTHVGHTFRGIYAYFLLMTAVSSVVTHQGSVVDMHIQVTPFEVLVATFSLDQALSLSVSGFLEHAFSSHYGLPPAGTPGRAMTQGEGSCHYPALVHAVHPMFEAAA